MRHLVVVTIDELWQMSREAVAELAPKETAAPAAVPDLVSEKELARWLNISVQTVRRHRAKGKIPFYDLDGRFFYDRAKVLEALEKR